MSASICSGTALHLIGYLHFALRIFTGMPNKRTDTLWTHRHTGHTHKHAHTSALTLLIATMHARECGSKIISGVTQGSVFHPYTEVPFWVPSFEPQPHRAGHSVVMTALNALELCSAGWSSPKWRTGSAPPHSWKTPPPKSHTPNPTSPDATHVTPDCIKMTPQLYAEASVCGPQPPRKISRLWQGHILSLSPS